MRATIPLFVTATLMFSGIGEADVTEASKRARAGAFDASQDIRCAQEVGEPFGTCTAAVARAAGSAAVVVTFANGFARTLMFDHGAFLRANATMSGVGTDTDWSLTDRVYQIRVDDQRFEIPEALVRVD